MHVHVPTPVVLNDAEQWYSLTLCYLKTNILALLVDASISSNLLQHFNFCIVR